MTYDRRQHGLLRLDRALRGLRLDRRASRSIPPYAAYRSGKMAAEEELPVRSDILIVHVDANREVRFQ
jgi:hypothetical protein